MQCSDVFFGRKYNSKASYAQFIGDKDFPMGRILARAHLAQSSDGWLWGDLLFLYDALAHGMSVEQVAGFLGRTVNEVRAKANLREDAATRGERSPEDLAQAGRMVSCNRAPGQSRFRNCHRRRYLSNGNT
jgi:hypothetical protein